MDIKRYIEIQAVLTREKELIPIWDQSLIFEKTEMYGNQISIKDKIEHTYSVVNAVFDLKTKKISMGVELDYYPEEKNIKFKKDEKVYYEIKHDTFKESKIKEIVFESFDLEITKGKKMHNFYKSSLKTEFDPETLYAIKTWKPVFILENGVKIDSEYRLKHKG